MNFCCTFNKTVSISPMNSSNVVLDVFGLYTTTYPIAFSVILTLLYAPVFILSLLGNITALVVMAKTVRQMYRMRTAYIINLVIADLSGMYTYRYKSLFSNV
jgi:hypothetical protein